jgi:hypothetical protein
MTWLAASVLLMGGVARAESAPASIGHEVSLSAATFTFSGYLRSTSRIYALEAAYHRQLALEGVWSNVRVGGGLRTGTAPAFTTPHVPLEGFVTGQFLGRVGVWQPAVGLEVGVGGFATLRPTLVNELSDHEDRRTGKFYLAISAAPLRFVLGRFVLSAAELQIGSPMLPLGVGMRQYLGLVRVGYVL